MGRAKKLADGFDTFDAVLDALKPHRRRPLAWKMAKIGPSKRRAARRRQKEARALKAEVHHLVKPPTRDRPTYAATAALGHAALRGEYVGRWFSCLGLMAEGRQYTLIELEGLWSLSKATAFSVVRTLLKRALVSRAANPGAFVGQGLVARRNPHRRPMKDVWLYARTDLASRVLSGEIEWRKPLGWNRLRAAKAGRVARTPAG